MYKVGIVGLGFLGGSLAKALKNSGKVDYIIACDKNLESLNLAKADGVIEDYKEELDGSFSDLDFVFICTPVSFIVDYAKRLGEIVKHDCIITDTGSTKRSIIDNLKDLNVEFIGAHPMIGSERSGYQTSKELLFENSYYIITKHEKNKDENIEKLKELIEAIKAIPIVVESDKHDYITAAISHVPHVIAAGLVNLVKQLDDENETMKMLAAGGFKDITRIASSDPTMWQNICFDNKEEILKVINVFENIIDNFKAGIENQDSTFGFFDSSKTYRDSFISRKIGGNTMPELNISVKDENGAIAKITTILSANEIGIKNIEVLNNRENNFGALRVVVRTYEERDKGYDVLTGFGFDVVKVN